MMRVRRAFPIGKSATAGDLAARESLGELVEGAKIAHDRHRHASPRLYQPLALILGPTEACADPLLDHGALARQGRAGTRRNSDPTCTAAQVPPREVATSRALSDRAIPRCEVTPLASILRMIGRMFAADRVASALRLATARPRTSSSLGLPSTTPRAFAAFNAYRVRCAISSVPSSQARRTSGA